jgi:hypothetical protein
VKASQPHLRAIRTEIAEPRNDGRDIKATLAVLRAYIADQHTEQSRLNTRLALAELRIDLRDE